MNSESNTEEQSVVDLLEIVEAHLTAPAGFLAEDRALESLNESLAALDEAVRRSPDEAAAFTERLDAARALAALRTRQVPDGALDGVYESIRARMAGAVDESDRALLRAGLSRSFLDAPPALAWWRRTAVAAVALVALGLGWWATAPVAPIGDGPAHTAGEALEPYDPRDDLLNRLTPASYSERPDGRGGAVVPMSNGSGPRVFRLRSGRSWEELRRLLDAMQSGRGVSPVERN